MRFRFHKTYILIFTLIISAVLFSIAIFSNYYQSKYSRDQQQIDYNPCYYIEKTESKDYKVDIKFTEPIPNHLQNTIHLYFGYQTQSFGLPLILQPGSLDLVQASSTNLTLNFPLPFIQYYSGHLTCVNPNHYEQSSFGIPSDILSKVDNFLPLDMNITTFRNSDDQNWSQMICYGNSYETRYCDMRNVAIYQKLFIFATKADYVFPQPFLSSSGRAPPFDRSEGRLVYEPSVIHSPITSLPGESIHYQSNPLCYVISHFYNSQMLWHMLFDFLVPAFHTFMQFENFEKIDKDYNDRHIFIRDNERLVHPQLLHSLSKYDIPNIYRDSITRQFQRVIVGLEKLEENPSTDRTPNEMLQIKYNYTNKTSPYIRKAIFNALSIKDHPIDSESPLILIVDRSQKSKKFTIRKFINIEEIEEYLLSRCDFCRVKRIEFSSQNLTEQIELISSASVLIGVHGSGLTNTLFMKPSSEKAPTALIELLPYGYHCRNWFQKAANVASVDYYSIMSKKILPNDASKTTKFNHCWTHPELCSTYECHDLLRDQDVIIEFGIMSSVWSRVVSQLRNAQQSLDE